MKPRKIATKEEINFIRQNKSMRPRDLAKQLGLLQSVVTYWIGRDKRKLINKPIRSVIKQVSEKRKEGLRLYKQAKREVLDEIKECQVCGNKENLSIHHIAGRAGSLLYDKTNFLVVCMAGSNYLNEKYQQSNQTEGCHPWIERNLKLARELGCSKSKIK